MESNWSRRKERGVEERLESGKDLKPGGRNESFHGGCVYKASS